MNILVVVDMQNDFIDGALGTPEAVAIVPKERSFRWCIASRELMDGRSKTRFSSC